LQKSRDPDGRHHCCKPSRTERPDCIGEEQPVFLAILKPTIPSGDPVPVAICLWRIPTRKTQIGLPGIPSGYKGRQRFLPHHPPLGVRRRVPGSVRPIIEQAAELFWEIRHELNAQRVRIRQEVAPGIQQYVAMASVFRPVLGISSRLPAQPQPMNGHSPGVQNIEWAGPVPLGGNHHKGCFTA